MDSGDFSDTDAGMVRLYLVYSNSLRKHVFSSPLEHNFHASEFPRQFFDDIRVSLGCNAPARLTPTFYRPRSPTPSMKPICSLAALVFFASMSSHAAEIKPVNVMHERHRGLLKENCEACHGSERQKGKFRVDDLSFALNDLQTAERWQKILDAINSGEMPPPEEKKQPGCGASIRGNTRTRSGSCWARMWM
jgi:hypothetical protein